MRYYVYLLKLNSKKLSYYIGSTPDINRRIEQHKSGYSKYTKKFLPVNLIYCECYNNEDIARKREKDLKRFGSAYYSLLKRLNLYKGA